MMSKDGIIGIYKFLEPNEEVIFENQHLTPVVLVKEAYLKKVLNRTERKEMPISFTLSKTYLTNKRLIFLILHQEYARDLGDEGSASLSDVEGSWFEVPTNAILDYDIRPLVIKEDTWSGNVEILDNILDGNLKNQSLLEIVYDEKQAGGRSLEYVEGMMKRGKLSKLFGKVQSTSDKIFILGSAATTIAPSLKQFEKNIDKEEDEKSDSFFCNKCGVAQNNLDSRFCSKCGNALQPPIAEMK